MTILTQGTPQQKIKEFLIAATMQSATKLADLDGASTSEVLRAIAHMVESRMAKEQNLCTHGCVMTHTCEHRNVFTCNLKSKTCEEVNDELREAKSEE